MARSSVAPQLLVARSTKSIEMPLPTGRFGSPRLSREGARSLQILSHAIEHLSDQYVGEDCPPAVESAINQAIQLLMSLHRAVFEESRQSTPAASSAWQFLERLAG